MQRTPLVILALCFLACAPCARADWPAQGRLVAGGAGLQYSPFLCPDGGGGTLVGWFRVADDTSADVFLQRFAPDGSVALGWPSAGVRAGRAYLPSAASPLYPMPLGHGIAPDGSGGAFVLWLDRTQDPGGDFRVLHVTASAQRAAGWPAEGIRLVPTPTYESGGTLLADETGGVFAAWCDLQDGDLHVHVQHLRGDGARVTGWPAGGARPKGGFYAQYDPALTPDGAGGVWVGWADEGFAGRPLAPAADSYVRVIHHVTAAGAPDAALPANGVGVGGRDTYVKVGLVSDAAGGAFVLWVGSSEPPTQFGIFAQRLAPDGSPVAGWPESGYHLATSGGFDERSAVGDDLGGALVAWTEHPAPTYRGQARAQRVRGDGTPAPGWSSTGVALGTASGTPSPVPDGFGGAILLWADSAAVVGETDLFAQRVRPDGGVSPVGGAPRLAVCTSPGSQGAYQVTTDGAGGMYAAWTDQRADAGDVYLTRLALADLSTGVNPPTTGNAWLRLGAPRPNPASGRVEVPCTLSRAGTVSVLVSDISGRRVRELVRAQLRDAGPFDLSWNGRDDGGRPAPSGVYLMIVRSGDACVTTRLLHVR